MIATQQVVLSVDLVIGHWSFGTLPILGFEILNLQRFEQLLFNN